MSFTGILSQISEQTSKKGNPYKRLLIQRDGAGDEWYTYFGTVPDQAIERRCAFTTKPLGDGVCIDTIIVDTEAPANAPATAAQHGTPGGHRDMWIATECFYQHYIANIGAEDTMEGIAYRSIRLAIIANETFRAYDEGGLVAARKILRASTDSENGPVSQVEAMADRAVAAESGASEPEFDDDIPF